MEKYILTYYDVVNPTTGNTVSNGYALGQHWFNSTTGIEYIHKSSGNWKSAESIFLPLSGGTLTGSLSGTTFYGSGSGLNGIPSSGITDTPWINYLPLTGGTLTGNLSIGENNGIYPLYVSGADGDDISIFATNDIVAYSDKSIKTNLEIIPNAIEKIKLINGYTFERTDSNSKNRRAGVIAQEVNEVMPEVVVVTLDGKMAVAYGNMVALLIQAIKEQQLQIEELKLKLE